RRRPGRSRFPSPGPPPPQMPPPSPYKHHCLHKTGGGGGEKKKKKKKAGPPPPIKSMINPCLKSLEKNFHTSHSSPINTTTPIASAAFNVNPSMSSPRRCTARRTPISKT